VVYDVVDDWFRSQTAMAMPAAIRLPRMLAEAVRARRADAILTVDRPQAVQLERRWRPRRPIVSIPNYPQIPRDVDVLHQDRIRAELGLPATTRIVLYQGNIGSAGPLRIAEKACLAIADACFVVIGFGAELERVRERDSDAQYRGRHFTLAARHPDELIAWTASADVVLMRFRASSPNDRLTVPNKLWEALAGGTPVVVGRGQGPMARFVERHDLGAVAEAMTPDAVAAAIRRVIDRGPEERAAWRARIAAEARERWDWRASDARYRALISQVVAEAGP
jgi:glycosyltransferase involved in cell wall biosynthesis